MPGAKPPHEYTIALIARRTHWTINEIERTPYGKLMRVWECISLIDGHNHKSDGND